MDEHQLTFEEEIYYANYGSIDTCDCCSDYAPIINHHDGSNYLTITENGCSLVCNKCK